MIFESGDSIAEHFLKGTKLNEIEADGDIELISARGNEGGILLHLGR